MQSLSFTIFTTLLVLALMTMTADAQKVDNDAPTLLRVMANSSINGSWKINTTESDNVQDKIQALMRAMTDVADSAEKPDPANPALPTLSISLVPPETLVLVASDEAETTINEGYKNLVLTRTIAGDGIARDFQVVGSSAYFTVKALPTGDKLTITTVSPRGNQLTEIYQPLSGGKQLKVMIRVKSPQAQELITLNRVYDRAAEEIPMMDEL